MWWQDRWTEFRDRLITSPEFRRGAARNPLTRFIARRHARALFDVCAGFVYSQVLLACVRLDVFGLLHERPRTADEVARLAGLTTDAADRLLRAACALKLCEPRAAGRYGLGALGAAMVGNSGLAAMVEHHVVLYADLRDPVALLRGEMAETGLARYWPYAGTSPAKALAAEATESYTALMAASQGLIAAEIVDAYTFDRHRRLLDVGGGDGSFAAAVAVRAPHLRITVFDLPSVADRAAARFADECTLSRITALGGDFFVDPLPGGADIVSLVRVLHDHDDAAAHRLLQAVRRALPAGGTLLVAEPMTQTPGAEPVGDAYFGFYLMAMGKGRPRPRHDIVRMLAAAGFGHARFVPTRIPLITSLLVAQALP